MRPEEEDKSEERGREREGERDSKNEIHMNIVNLES